MKAFGPGLVFCLIIGVFWFLAEHKPMPKHQLPAPTTCSHFDREILGICKP